MTELSPVAWVAAMKRIAQGRDASKCRRLKERGEQADPQKAERTVLTVLSENL